MAKYKSGYSLYIFESGPEIDKIWEIILAKILVQTTYVLSCMHDPYPLHSQPTGA